MINRGIKHYLAKDVILLSGFLTILWMLGVYLQERGHYKNYYIMYGILVFIVIAIIIANLFRFIDNYKVGEYKQIIFNKKKFSINHMTILYFIILVICWVPYIIMCFPGNIWYDSGTSILYFLDIYRENTNNPPLQNIIFGGTYLLGKSIGNVNIAIFLYCIVQFLLYAATISYGIKLLIKNCIPSKVIIFIMLLYCICPIFPLYAFSMGKDCNFAVMFLIFEILLFKILDNKEKATTKYILVFAFISISLGLLRNATYIIVVMTLISLLFIKRKKINNNIIVITILLTIVANVVAPNVLGVPSASKGDALSIPLQQTAYYMKHNTESVTKEEYDNIYKVLPNVDFNKYNPDISDPIKAHFNNGASTSELKQYFKTWFEQFKKDPLSYVKATILGTYAYYSPIVDKSDIKAHAAIGIGVSEKVVNETDIEYNDNPLLRYAKALDDEFKELPIVGLLSKIGIYTWMVLISAVYLLTRKRYNNLICILPLILLLGMCILSPVNGYFRYAFNMILSIPIILPLILFLDNSKNNIK